MPIIERLEPRRLLADVSLLPDGTLLVTSDGDTLNVSAESGASPALIADGERFDFDPAAVTALALRGSAGGDVIDLSNLPAGVGVEAGLGGGNDRFVGPTSGDAYVVGGLGDDTITTGGGDDLIRGEGGDDLIDAGGGLDTIYGHAGSDTLLGGDDNDYVDGGGDAGDSLDGGNGADSLVSAGPRQGEGDATLVGGLGDDWLEGGEGRDTLWGGRAGSTTGLGLTVAVGGGGPGDLIVGAGGDDSLDGGLGDDTIQGHGGDDDLFGGEGGNDELDGGRGTDGLLAGPGSTLTGGGGPDRFIDPVGLADREGGTFEIADYRGDDDVRLRFTDEDGDDPDARWTLDEIRRADAALGLIHRAIDDDRVFKTPTRGRNLEFRKSLPDEDLGENVAGTYLDGLIRVYGDQGDFLPAVIAHETAHNLDDLADRRGYDELSDWVQSNRSPGPDFVRGAGFESDDDESFGVPWYYREGSWFPSDYARTDPFEDFAETFEFYFRTLGQPDDGERWEGNGPADGDEDVRAAKLAFVRSLVASF